MEGKSLPKLLFDNSTSDLTTKKRKNDTPVVAAGLCGKRHLGRLQSSEASMELPWSSRGELDANETKPPSEKKPAVNDNDGQRAQSSLEVKVPKVKEQEMNTKTNGETNYQTFSEVLSHIGQNAKMAVLQFSQSLGESELFEQQGLQAMNDLQKHARILEQSLNAQKETLCSRLKMISDGLKYEQ